MLVGKSWMWLMEGAWRILGYMLDIAVAIGHPGVEDFTCIVIGSILSYVTVRSIATKVLLKWGTKKSSNSGSKLLAENHPECDATILTFSFMFRVVLVLSLALHLSFFELSQSLSFPVDESSRLGCTESNRRNTTLDMYPKITCFTVVGTRVPRNPLWCIFRVTTAIALANDTKQMETP